MLNNYWEEKGMNKDIYVFHEKMSEEMNLPKWMRDIKCPFCNKGLPARSIRNVRLCLNTRNFGEIAIEVFCEDCSKMDTLYFKTKIQNLSDFVDYLNGKFPEGDPILEEKMYSLQYNNVMERMIKKQGDMK